MQAEGLEDLQSLQVYTLNVLQYASYIRRVFLVQCFVIRIDFFFFHILLSIVSGLFLVGFIFTQLVFMVLFSRLIKSSFFGFSPNILCLHIIH